MLAQAVSKGTKRSKKKDTVEVQKGSVDEKRTQEELFGRKRNNAKKMRKHINDECKYGISKTQALQLRRQRSRKGGTVRLSHVSGDWRMTLSVTFSRSESVISTDSPRVRRAGEEENILSKAQKMSRSNRAGERPISSMENATWTTWARP